MLQNYLLLCGLLTCRRRLEGALRSRRRGESPTMIGRHHLLRPHLRLGSSHVARRFPMTSHHYFRRLLLGCTCPSPLLARRGSNNTILGVRHSQNPTFPDVRPPPHKAFWQIRQPLHVHFLVHVRPLFVPLLPLPLLLPLRRWIRPAARAARCSISSGLWTVPYIADSPTSSRANFWITT